VAFYPLLEAQDDVHQEFPAWAVVETGHPLSCSFIPGHSASELIGIIIRHVIKEIGYTDPVTIASLLPDWEPSGLTMHNSLKPQGSATAMTCTKPSPIEEQGLNSSTRLTSPGGEPALDCQRLSGPESDISSEGGGAENIKAPTPDGPGEQRGKKKARSRFTCFSKFTSLHQT